MPRSPPSSAAGRAPWKSTPAHPRQARGQDRSLRTHKHPKVKAWLAKHPRFHLPFTTTSSSWLNLVERFFADLIASVVREGRLASVRELVTALETCLAGRNLAPKPYRWQAKGADLLEKIRHTKAAPTLQHGIS